MTQDIFSNGIVRLYHISITVRPGSIKRALTVVGDEHIIITNLESKSDDEDMMVGIRSQRGMRLLGASWTEPMITASEPQDRTE